jgi:sensor histidine kinase YesM
MVIHVLQLHVLITSKSLMAWNLHIIQYTSIDDQSSVCHLSCWMTNVWLDNKQMVFISDYIVHVRLINNHQFWSLFLGMFYSDWFISIKGYCAGLIYVYGIMSWYYVITCVLVILVLCSKHVLLMIWYCVSGQ